MSKALTTKASTSPQTLYDREFVWNGATGLAMAKRGGVVTKRNARMLRQWSESSPFVRAAIQHRKSQVAMADWDIVPVDPDKPFDDDAKLALLTLFNNPNNMRDSFRSLLERMLEDELVLDAGVLEKELNRQGLPIALYNMDASEIHVVETWDGTDQSAPRYLWVKENKVKAAYTNDEMIYVINNPRTYSVLGLSPLEVLQETIEAEFDAMRYNASMVRQTAPPGIINLGEGMGVGQVEKFKYYWDNEIAGQATVAVIGGSKGVQFIPMGASQREMMFQEWVDYLCRKIAAAFGISPQDIGIIFDVNRSNGEVQSRISDDRGLKTLLTNNEQYINREIVADFRRVMARKKLYAGEITQKEFMISETLASIPARQIYETLKGPQKPQGQGNFYRYLVDNDPLNLMFSFTELNTRDMAATIDLQLKRLNNQPTLSINEARQEQGLDPVEGGDEILIDNGGNKVPLSMIKSIAETAAKNAASMAKQAENMANTPPSPEGTGPETGAMGRGPGSGSAKKPTGEQINEATSNEAD